ncbi:MAG: peptidoglycan bridge formation glycyltransferase FemA/FemB family protein [Candidatus Paceibacterota bacterium]|jgi:lipid II:glycine glycyltransferase (peptidoglycan interpeptide bridge formation enzyme)
MTIIEIKDKKEWEEFLLQVKEKTFCQSWNWGEFNKLMGDKIWRFGIESNGKILAVFQILKISAKRGKFIFLPHGPAILEGADFEKTLEVCFKKIKELSKLEKVSFIRIAPIFLRIEKNIKMFKDLGFINAPTHMHPELTWELDLKDSEEELLKNMRKTTRYLIKQGAKDSDLEIVKSQSLEDLEAFKDVYQVTADRHSFTPFSFDYLKKELLSFKEGNEVLIFSAKYKGEIISSAMIIYWSGMAFYHQGASTLKYPKIPASYLLQWEAIKEAKKRNCVLYNFWGIAPEEDLEKNKNHPWYGLSLFKKGFGGYKKEYVKTQDYPLSLSYWLTYIFEELRKKKRNL